MSIKTILNRDTLRDVYLDYTNNYLTLDKFSEHYGLWPDEARALVELCKSVFNTNHPEA